MREAVRLRRAFIVDGWDVVFIARSAIGRASYAEIAQGVENLLMRADLYKSVNSGKRSE